MPRAVLTICNERGLHARAAARFVKLASSFDARVTVSKDGTTVSGSSIMGLMMLAAANGCDIEVETEGPEAAEALEALGQLVADKFEEEDS